MGECLAGLLGLKGCDQPFKLTGSEFTICISWGLILGPILFNAFFFKRPQVKRYGHALPQAPSALSTRLKLLPIPLSLRELLWMLSEAV